MDAVTLEGLAFIGFTLGWGGGTIPLTVDGGETRWCREPRRLPDLVERLGGEQLDLSVGLACDLADLDTLTSSPILWTWVEGTAQVGLAKAFRPLPSLIVKAGTGSRRLLVWTLCEQPVSPSTAQANRRLSYRLRAPQTTASPEKLRIPLPGTLLKLGRKRPAPVTVTRMQLDGFHVDDIVGRLKEPPDPNAWRERRAAA